MKNILLLVILASSVCGAQTEPEKIDTKELFNTVERADLELDDEVKIEDINPTIEMPKLELNPDMVKKTHTRQRHSIKTTIKKKATTEPTTKPVTKATVKPAKAKQIIMVKRPIVRSQLRKNDKIVTFKDSIFVYRTTNKHILQYDYNSQIPFTSKGLKASGSDFVVIDPIILNKDIRALNKVQKSQKVQKVQKTKLTPTTQDIPVPTKRHEIVKIKKNIEKKYNKSRKIRNSILLENLKINDVIYLVNGLQFVKRKTASSIRKYWLTTMINKDAKNLESIGNNKYRVIAVNDK